MKIGLATRDITPPLHTPMGGQPFACQADGIESPLHVRAMCLDDGHTRVLLVSAEVLLLPNGWVAGLSRRLAAAARVPSRHVLLTATHTHSGPATVGVLGSNSLRGYRPWFDRQAVAAAREAAARAEPGRLRVASGDAPGWAFNRRFLMSDGAVETHPLKGHPHIVRPEGPDSTRLTAWRADAADGRSLGGMLKFGCHATVMERANTRISSDYPGRAATALAGRLGPEAQVLFLPGACGNICQVNPRDPRRREVGRAWVRTMGEALARRAAALLERAEDARGPLRVLDATLRLRRRAVPPDLAAWGRARRPTPGAEPRLSDYGVEPFGRCPRGTLSLADYFKTPYWADALAHDLRQGVRQRMARPVIPVRLSVIVQDNWALVALPAEVFIEWSLAIERASPFEHTAVVELANGWNGYLPTPEAFRRAGGYETLPLSDVSILEPGAGQQIADRAAALLLRAYRRRS